MKFRLLTPLFFGMFLFCGLRLFPQEPHVERFEGKFYSGKGDLEFLRLLELSRQFFAPSPVMQDISMLYSKDWNGFVEGPTWNAWWVQNSYGTSFAELPFLEEP